MDQSTWDSRPTWMATAQVKRRTTMPIILERSQEKQQDENKMNKAIVNVLSFYKEKQAICEKAYDFYSDYAKQINNYVEKPEPTNQDSFCEKLGETIILVITVNEIEEGIFLHWLFQEKNDGKAIKSYLVDSVTYNVFSIDKKKTIIQIRPPRTGEDDTRRWINKARKLFKPNYICMLGVCYGLNMDNHSIGSVFIADSIRTFRLNYRDGENEEEVIFEAEEELNMKPDNDFIIMIKQVKRLLQSPVFLDQNEYVATETGMFLSNNSLVSSQRVKRAILEQCATLKPKPLGGEMEGAGILKSYYVEEEGFNHWLMIKSICDWGEKKNASNSEINDIPNLKEKLQSLAMVNTCTAFSQILDYLN